MDNVSGTTEFGLSVFGGLNTSMQPTDLPAGLSWDCVDVCFAPGSMGTRPPLATLATLNTASQIVYFHSYVRPDGSVVQLLFDSLGGIYADGAKIAQTRAGNRFHAVNAFGKCFIAISDGMHGQDVPLQVDQSLNVDRVSQDGPGSAVTVTNYSIPAQSLVSGSSGAAVTITTIQPIDPETVQTGGGYDEGFDPGSSQTYYTALRVTCAAPHGLTVGETVNIAGNTYATSAAYVNAVDSATVFEVSYYTPSSASASGGTVTLVAPLLSRKNGKVSATTASAHQLKIGYRVVVDGLTDASQAVTSVVINNDTMPNAATVATPSAHGFVPGNTVALLGINPVSIPVASWTVSASEISGTQVLQFVTTNPHGLRVGDSVVESTNGGAPRQHPVDTVLDAHTFTMLTTGASGSGTTATLTTVWTADSGQTFTVQTVPSLTTFTVQISGPSETWTGGTVTYPWNGTFYVSSVPSANSFAYAQSGPDATVQSGTGTVTPQGQIAPGQHTFWQVFLTREGYLTRPGPKVTFNASGNQYAFFSNLSIGPPNVVARWIIGTGANGSRVFAIPVPYQNGTQIEGTSTTVDDNVTTSAIMDFSDQALESSLSVDSPGNNLFRLVVIDSALGLFSYGSRLIAWGMRNRIAAFYNMGFEGGVLASATNAPCGWSGGTGTLVAGDYGMGFQFGVGGVGGAIYQGAYQDENGAPILKTQTLYRFRAWATGLVTAQIYSATAGVLATSTLTAAAGNFNSANFSVMTPASMPQDTVLRVFADAAGTTIDELSIYDAKNPYLMQALASYVENEESFDGETGIFGPSGPLPVRAIYNRRDVLNLLTEGPDGKRYETESSASEEPSGWSIRTMSSKCGAVSVWGTATFEDYEVWVSDTGLRIDVGQVDKLSQEVQTFFDSINPAYRHLTVVANDPYTRRVYILAATGTSTVTNGTIVLDYRELSTASLLESAGTLKVSSLGRVVTTDLTRKWSEWTITAHFCGIYYASDGSARIAFAGGGAVSKGSIYSLTEGSLAGIDEDYGPFWANFSYSTAFLLDGDTAQSMRLGQHRLTHRGVTGNITGMGAAYLIPNANREGNTKKQSRALAVTPDLARDLQFALWLAADRVSYTIKCQPQGVAPFSPTAHAGISVSSLTVSMVTDSFSPIRQGNF